MSPLIQVEGLGKTYRGATRPALKGVGLTVEAGQVLGIVGPNGAGKTTLFGCLLGLLNFEGTVLLHGRDPRDPEARRGCGYVPERLTFDPYMKANAFVDYHYRLGGGDEAGREAAVDWAMDAVGMDPRDRDRRVKLFSRGNLQRLALAQAIVAGPDILFLDEPTSGMDPLGVARFKELVRGLLAKGCAVVFNSHQLAQVQDLSDSVLFLSEGEVATHRKLRHTRMGQPLRLQWLGPADARARLEKLAKRKGLPFLAQRGNAAIVQVADDAAAAELITLAVRSGIKLCEARQAGEDLESTFKRLFRSVA